MEKESLANSDEMVRQPFSSGWKEEDLLDWSKKLEALGMVIETLAFRNDEVLSMHGEHLGQMVVDYARAIYQTAHEVYWTINKFYKKKESGENQGKPEEKRASAMIGNHAKAQGEDL